MTKTIKHSEEPTAQPPSAPDPSDLVTVCAWSNTVRHQGEWLGFGEYLSQRFGLRATHGISPRALAQLETGMRSESRPPAAVQRGDQAALRNPQRLAALRGTGLLDSPTTEAFDRITRLGAIALNVPATFISLVDEHRDFYLSNFGFGEPLASERQLSGQTFCHFTIKRENTLVIPDTRADPLYRDVPTVESLGVAAYLGAPLTLLNGETIGSFCAIDHTPRAWTSAEIRSAEDLANLVTTEIELRAAIKSFCNAD